jgi:dihydrofolate synthase/folylpolyglutamate synthase
MQSLAEWLDYQQRIHPRSIELGLARVGEVWRRMGAPVPAPVVITVGGTNGKGSTVAFLEAMLAADGKRVGCYTSPHLLRYNERVRVAGVDVDDALLIDAFERIEVAREVASLREIPLTYFEFGTLAAFWIFSRAGLDAALLEVGLGGRLDAVNIIDADAAVVTTVDLDHQDWLGNDRDSIGREKAGIFRCGRPAIIGMREPVQGLLDETVRLGAEVVRAGRDYTVTVHDAGWQWRSGASGLNLPLPTLAAVCQVDNAAAAITAIFKLRDRLGWNPEALGVGVRKAWVAARLQLLTTPGAADVIVDVAHNPQAARALAQWLGGNPVPGRTFAVFGALDDKDVGGIVTPLLPHIDGWILAGLAGLTSRGLPVAQLQAHVQAVASTNLAAAYDDPRAALARARALASPQDRIVAFGSFYVAAEVLVAMKAG